jgi:hypothetical protein
MKYGINSLLVEEVIEVASNLRLTYNKNLLEQDYTINHDYDEAQELAWSQDLDEVDTVWEDVKSSESGEILGKLYEENVNYFEKTLREILNTSKNYPEEFLLDYIDIFEEVSGDLHQCALNRLVNGKADNFFERVFQVYKQGGWPCGWDGKYPGGRMIIYMPSEV